MVKYLSFHNSSSFCLKILFNVNGKATMTHPPLVLYVPMTLVHYFSISIHIIVVSEVSSRIELQSNIRT
jgi:hypothetical protein